MGEYSWDTESGAELLTLSGHKSADHTFSLANDSKRWLFHEEGTVNGGRCRKAKQRKLETPIILARCGELYHEGQLASCGRDGTVLFNGRQWLTGSANWNSRASCLWRAFFNEGCKRVFNHNFNGNCAWKPDCKRIGEIEAPNRSVPKAMVERK